MIKRGIIQFSGQQKFRISKPGIDVDQATANELLLDERVLYSQIVSTGVVVNPAVGAENTQTTPLVDIDIGIASLVYCYAVVGPSVSYPTIWSYSGGFQAIYYFFFNVTPTTLSIQFLTQSYVDAVQYVQIRMMDV